MYTVHRRPLASLLQILTLLSKTPGPTTIQLSLHPCLIYHWVVDKNPHNHITSIGLLPLQTKKFKKSFTFINWTITCINTTIAFLRKRGIYLLLTIGSQTHAIHALPTTSRLNNSKHSTKTKLYNRTTKIITTTISTIENQQHTK